MENIAQLDYQSTDTRKIYDLRGTNIMGAKLLGHYNYQQAGHGLERHQHPNMFEICYLEKGTQIYEVESKEYLLKGGDILLTKPGQIHGTSNFPESIGSLYWLILDSPEKNRPLLGLNETWTTVLYSEIISVPNIHFSGNQRIKQLFRNLESQCNSIQNPLVQLQILRIILNILLEVVELSKDNNEVHLPGDIDRVLTFIKDNINNQLSIEELCEITGLSQSRFKHKFREYVGRSPIDFINGQKIEVAKKLIPESTSMKDVGYQLGYSSPAYFSHVFKKYTSMTPLEYKEVARESSYP